MLTIATRGSPLALAQAEQVRDALLAAHPGLRPEQVRLQVVRTSGDRFLGRPLAEIGGKGLFTKEIEEALLAGAADIAVHSAKDMPTRLPEGLRLAAFPPRADPRDALISRHDGGLDRLPEAARVGTASLRRRAQLLRRRPDLLVELLRGNVGRRIARIDAGEFDATLLALAGLERLGLAERASHVLSPEEMLPAPAQGAIAIEARTDDTRIADLLAPLDDPGTRVTVAAERALLDALDGSCRTPIAALARCDGGEVRLVARLLEPDGSWCAEERGDAPADEDAAAALGRRLGERLRARAGDGFFRRLADAAPS
ncbi:MAG: hydroxymethylbilane synthase [Alphaproteobacteria bacterium]|nr:MAG: hydroxymethylbilane synthase [Alphaproteobacteria bacterium]